MTRYRYHAHRREDPEPVTAAHVVVAVAGGIAAAVTAWVAIVVATVWLQ